MTVLLVCSQHPFAGTSRSRRRTRFIPTPASAGRASPITASIRPSPSVAAAVSPRSPAASSSRRSSRKPSLRKAAAASNPHSRPTARRPPAGSFLGGFRTPAPYTGPIARAGPASETLPDSRPRCHRYCCAKQQTLPSARERTPQGRGGGPRDRSQPAAISRIPIARVFREPSIGLGLRDAVFGFRQLIYRARSSPNPD